MTLIQTPFSKTSTADDVVAGIDLAGKRAIVTGGASGIGIETARALAKAGADVTLAVRNVAVGKAVAADIVASTGNNNVHVESVDLVDRASINDFVARWQGPLQLLINNAAVMASPLIRTAEGWELQFATNHLGHFALTLGLHEALKAAGNARVVNVSSSGHLTSPVHLDDLHFERREYTPWMAYGQAKTANVLFAVEITKRWKNDGIVANAHRERALAAIDAAVIRLPRRQRAVVRRTFAGESASDVAADLRVHPSTVSRERSAAIITLRNVVAAA